MAYSAAYHMCCRTLTYTPGGHSEIAVDYGHWSAEVSDLTGEERRDALLSLVLGEIAAALGHKAIDCVEPDQPLEELGVESLVSMEIRERIPTPPAYGCQ